MYVCIFSGDEMECYLSIQGTYDYKCKSFVMVENEHTLDPKGDHIAEDQGMKVQAKPSFRSKA